MSDSDHVRGAQVSLSLVCGWFAAGSWCARGSRAAGRTLAGSWERASRELAGAGRELARSWEKAGKDPERIRGGSGEDLVGRMW